MDNHVVTAGSIIRHKRFMDVACRVLSRHSSTFKVSWVNLGFVSSYEMGVKQTLKIRDLKDWQICFDRDVQCFRHAKWGDL